MKAKTKVAIKFWFRLILGNVIIFGSVLGFGAIIGKFLETIFMFIGYFSTVFVVPRIKHFDTTQKCVSVTTLTLLFAIGIVVLPKNISLIWSVLIGALIPLFMYAESLLFDVKISDKDKLIALCKAHGYNELKTEMAIKFFIDKEKPKDVWLWLLETKKSDIEWDSVRRLKCIMKKELFK